MHLPPPEVEMSARLATRLDVNDRLFGSPHHTQTICQLGHHHSEVKEAEPAGVPTVKK